MALKEWQNTNSPITHWSNMVKRYLDPDSEFYDPNMLNVETTDHYTFLYGLPKRDAQKICMTMYKETIAKVTVEILEPMVMQIRKDKKTSFTEQIGVVGMKVVSIYKMCKTL